MNLKKFNISLILGIVITFSIASIVFAGYTELASMSEDTYVAHYHPDGLSDDYYGFLSIKGSDRELRYGTYYYPRLVKITWNLRGTLKSNILESRSETDTQVLKKRVQFKDKWDFGEVTRVSGNINLVPAKVRLYRLR